MPRLSARLQLFHDHLRPGEPVWDLCCDHGLLGLAALFSGRFASVHFVDRAEPLVRALEERVRAKSPPVPCSFHPLEAQKLEEILSGTVVVAGVGGALSLEILETLESRGRLKARRLLLSPQTLLRSFPEDFERRLGPAGWRLVEEHRVQEGRRERVLWVAERAFPQS